jgi:hypothetical protein
MRCTLESLIRRGFHCNWITLLVGRNLGLIEPLEVTRYVEEYITDHPNETDPLIMELAWNAERRVIDENLEKLIITIYGQRVNEDSVQWKTEERKWRYCILKKLRTDIQNHEQLLEKVAEVYSDMGYPNDMESFIYYMPPNDGYDPTKYTRDQNHQRLIQMFDVFLEKEKGELIR